jgi:hypothetical protein
MEPTPRVAYRVRSDFDDREAEQAIERLRSLSGVDDAGLSERIQAAVVKLSAGDWSRLEASLELARIDWRDVLVAADLAGNDWRARLDDYLGQPSDGPAVPR